MTPAAAGLAPAEPLATPAAAPFRNPFAAGGRVGVDGAAPVPRPADLTPLVAVLARGGRVGLIGRRGAGKRTLLHALADRATRLEVDVLRADASRATSWLEVADALATRLHDLDGGFDGLRGDPCAPREHALRLYRAGVTGRRAPADRTSAGATRAAPAAAGWTIRLARPREVAPARWPAVALAAVLEEVARRAVAGRGRYAVLLEGVDALAAETTANDAAHVAGALARTLGEAKGGPDGGAPFALVLAGAGPTGEAALGPLRSAVDDVRTLGPMPRDAFGPWLAERLAAGAAMAAADAVERLLDAADDLPHLAVELARECWDQWRDRRAAGEKSGGHEQIVAWHVDRAADALARRAAPAYAARWAALPSSQRVALLAVLDAAERAREGRLGRADGLASTRTHAETGLPITTLQRAVEGLVAKGVLWRGPDPTGRVALRPAEPLFARWARLGLG